MTINSPTQMLEDEHLVIAKVVGAIPILADRIETDRGIICASVQQCSHAGPHFLIDHLVSAAKDFHFHVG